MPCPPHLLSFIVCLLYRPSSPISFLHLLYIKTVWIVYWLKSSSFVCSNSSSSSSSGGGSSSSSRSSSSSSPQMPSIFVFTTSPCSVSPPATVLQLPVLLLLMQFVNRWVR
jgi:hypothetical protein